MKVLNKQGLVRDIEQLDDRFLLMQLDVLGISNDQISEISDVELFRKFLVFMSADRAEDLQKAEFTPNDLFEIASRMEFIEDIFESPQYHTFNRINGNVRSIRQKGIRRIL